MKMLTVIAALVLGALPANAQDKTPKELIDQQMGFTVQEVMNIGNALAQLGDHQEIVNDRPITVKVPFIFDGNVLIVMALNIETSNRIIKTYSDSDEKFRRSLMPEGKDEVPKERIPELTAWRAKAVEAQTNANMIHIKERDLCMASKIEAPCKAKNDIPPALLAAIIKIIDR